MGLTYGLIPLISLIRLISCLFSQQNQTIKCSGHKSRGIFFNSVIHRLFFEENINFKVYDQWIVG